VAVAAVVVVGDEHVRADRPDRGGHVGGGLVGRGRGEAVRRGVLRGGGPAVGAPGHAGVVVVARAAGEAHGGVEGGRLPREEALGHPQAGRGVVELADPVPAQGRAVVGALRAADLQRVQRLGDHLAALAAGHGEQHDPCAELRVPAHGGAGGDGLVVGVRVHEQEPGVLRAQARRQQPRQGVLAHEDALLGVVRDGLLGHGRACCAVLVRSGVRRGPGPGAPSSARWRRG
jgi:hypothetical protein